MSDLTIITSPLVKDGTQVWMKGSDVIGITTDERSKFLGLFGLASEAPRRANSVVVSPGDFEAIKAAAPLSLVGEK